MIRKRKHVDMNFTNACTQAQSISKFVPLHILFSIEAFLSLSATPANFIFLLIIGKVGTFHINLRILLAYLSFNLLLFSLSNLAKSLSVLSFITLNNHCSSAITIFYCRLFELPMTIPNINTVYLLMAILLERLYSTVRHRLYDNTKRINGVQNPCLAIILLLLISALSAWLAGTGAHNSPPGVYTAICDTYLTHPAGASAGIGIIQGTLELIALGFSIFVFLYNRYMLKQIFINRSKYTLTSRFQIHQNVQIDRVLVPTLLLHVCTFLPTYAFMYFVFGRLNLEFKSKLILTQVMQIMKLLYALLHPLLLFAKNPPVRQRLLKIFKLEKTNQNQPKRIGENSPQSFTPGQNAAAHFELLERIWADEAAKKRSKNICDKKEKI